MMNSSNPLLKEDTFSNARADGSAMTVNGTITRTLVLLVLVVAGAVFTWQKFHADPTDAMGYAMGGAIGGLVLALITMFFNQASPFTAPVYAICEGLLLGAISAILERKFKGIVLDAVLLTFGTLFCMLTAYRSGIVRATEKFKLGMMAALGAIFVVYLVDSIMRMFGTPVPYIHEGGTVGIIFSLVVVVVAALSFVLDFDFIEQGEAAGAPKYMEWYGAFSLLVTLIWLYLEILSLLNKLRGSDR